MANVFKFGNGCQLALNLDNVGAVDVSEVENKWCVRFFFTGGNGAYNLSTDNKFREEKDSVSIVKTNTYKGILSFLNTLEVKEGDLDTNFGVCWGEYCDCGGNINDYNVAKYFFELGLKAQKGGL